MTSNRDIAGASEADAELHGILEQPGQFELPVPHNTQSADRGAALAEWSEQDEAAAGTHEDFPMIVWLRGDEPWFSSFDMDADAVMRTLGIKRSRLTQIAGKDLRVGRVRVDRYIRPVFRGKDVQQYLSWTRATASHQKSSDAIKTAVEGLTKQSDLIKETLSHVSSTFTAEIRAELREFIASSVQSGIQPATETVTQLSALIERNIEDLNTRINTATDGFTTTAAQLTETVSHLQKSQQAALELMTLRMNQTSEKVAIMEERLTAWDQFLTDNLTLIQDQIKGLSHGTDFTRGLPRKIKKSKTSQKPAKPLLSLRAAPGKRHP